MHEGFNLGDEINRRIEDWNARQTYPATVVAKSGTTVTVRRLGALSTEAPEGPYSAAWGVSGAVRPGDIVLVSWRDGQPFVAMPPEIGLRRALNVVGEDLTTRQTTSHTDWDLLLDVDDLAIPPGVPFRCEWHTEVEPVGGAGASAKQNRLVFNGTEALDISIGSASAQAWVPWQVSTYAGGLAAPARSAQLMTASSPTVIAVPLDTITRITVLARTNDTGEGNDIVRCAELVVSL